MEVKINVDFLLSRSRRHWLYLVIGLLYYSSNSRCRTVSTYLGGGIKALRLALSTSATRSEFVGC